MPMYNLQYVSSVKGYRDIDSYRDFIFNKYYLSDIIYCTDILWVNDTAPKCNRSIIEEYDNYPDIDEVGDMQGLIYREYEEHNSYSCVGICRLYNKDEDVIMFMWGGITTPYLIFTDLQRWLTHNTRNRVKACCRDRIIVETHWISRLLS